MNYVIKKTVLGLAITAYAMLTGLSAMADDTEIFFLEN